MREVLDRLREAETTLDKAVMEEHYRNPSADITPTMKRLWNAKYMLWRAQMFILDAAVGSEEPDST